MRSNDRAVDHHVIVVPIAAERVEQVLPHTLASPAGEALVHAFVGTVARRQIAPARAQAPHPKPCINEPSVVCRHAARITGLARQQLLDTRPLLVAEFVTAGSDEDAPSLIP